VSQFAHLGIAAAAADAAAGVVGQSTKPLSENPNFFVVTVQAQSAD
jgi:acyl-coenzyme A thioesterase PaaI-like protein